jgi:hypothetical protein
MTPLADALKDMLPEAGSYACAGRCGARVELPGICSDCAARLDAVEHEKRLRAWLRTIPPLYRDVTWETLPHLKRDDGTPRVALANPSSERWQALRWEKIEPSPRVVLIGPPGNGKTSVAVAHLRARFDRRPADRVRFVAAEDLDKVVEPSPMALALSAEVLVLDDLGADLRSAEVGSGLLAQRMEFAAKVIAHRFEHRLPLVVTTGLDRGRVAALYGDRVARRLYEGAAVVRLGGGPAT